MDQTVVPQAQWDSTERRGIQVHVLNHIEERIKNYTSQVSALVEDHTKDEMERYAEILERIERNNTESIRRHSELLRSVESHMNKTEEIYNCFQEAFPPDKKGNPDFVGHSRAHESWIEKAPQEKELLAYVKEQMGKGSKREEDMRFLLRAVSTAVVIGLVMWAGKSLVSDAVHIAPTLKEVAK